MFQYANECESESQHQIQSDNLHQKYRVRDEIISDLLMEIAICQMTDSDLNGRLGQENAAD